MCRDLRNIDFFAMISLILLELASFIMFFIMLIYTMGLDKVKYEKMYYANLVHALLSIFLELLSIATIAVLGLHSLYFKMTRRLFWYIIW
jgi:hypothetical protein